MILSCEDIMRHLQKIDVRKAIGEDRIPTKILKLTSDILCPYLTTTINRSIKEMHFPEYAKRAAVTPIYKSGTKAVKKNYRPVSILNSFSKIFENVIKEQIVPFFDKCLSAFTSAYRKCYSSQHVLIRLIEKWRKQLDQSKQVGIIYVYVFCITVQLKIEIEIEIHVV